MRSLILGTAGHIDHGKTELVRALTGIDTDRLKEEKERGITIELGFAELPAEDVRIGVVDVPGHEGFIRNMLAGATGMDVVVLVVASDEGVMPQTREHLAIVELLGVERLVVALTKADLVEEEWQALVKDDVASTLAATRFEGAPMVPTSSRTGEGLDELRALLVSTASQAPTGDPDDLFALPLDRVFTVRGTGTVVTGTLSSGRVSLGEKARLLPDGLAGRVRALQVHGSEVDQALAGQRTAVALVGEDMDREHVLRGQTLVSHPGWLPSSMLTVRFSLLPDTSWELVHNQRVRVHLGTAEVFARCVLFSDDPLRAGGACWGQLRLESPVAARARQRLVLRSYSPMTTIGGAIVAETHPPKRRGGGPELESSLLETLDAEPFGAVQSVCERAEWEGAVRDLLPVTTGCAPAAVERAVHALLGQGTVMTAAGRLVGRSWAQRAEAALMEKIEHTHVESPFMGGTAIEDLRDALPPSAAPGLANAMLARMEEAGAVVITDGIVARKGFHPRFTAHQGAVRDRLCALYESSGPAPPTVEELPAELRSEPAFWVLLRGLEAAGLLTALDQGLYIWTGVLDAAVEAVRTALAGRDGLGPADFKEAVPVSRRHLLPILAHMDRTGVTLRSADGRSVPTGNPREQSGV